MKLLTCPINGTHPISEFIYGGEYRPMPSPNTASDKGWADYVFNRDNVPSIKKEWWCHLASNTWFIAERDTRSDEVRQTYLFNLEHMQGHHE